MQIYFHLVVYKQTEPFTFSRLYYYHCINFLSHWIAMYVLESCIQHGIYMRQSMGNSFFFCLFFLFMPSQKLQSAMRTNNFHKRLQLLILGHIEFFYTEFVIKILTKQKHAVRYSQRHRVSKINFLSGKKHGASSVR